MQDERKKIEEFKARREARLAKRGGKYGGEKRMDSVAAFYERRNERRSDRNLPNIKYNQSAQKVDNRGKVWYNNGAGEKRFDSNPRLPFGLCEKEGIHLPKGATPKDAWDALAERGITPESAYQNAESSSSGSGTNNAEANKEKAASISGKFAKKRNFKKESPTMVQSIQEALDHGMSEEKIGQVLDNLTDDDIYEMNGESGVIGLAAKIDDEVVGKSEECQKIWNKAKENGTPITNDVIDITKSLGATMSGLEFAVKAGKSTSEKIDREHAERKEETGQEDPRSDEQILSSLKDVVRFTQFSPHEKLAENASETIKMLEDKGYDILLCKNRYASPKPQEYYDIKIVAANPEGQSFELQFHSKESLDVKNKNHKLYEKQRAVGVSDAEKARLGAEMMKNSASLAKPSGYEKIPNFDKTKKE